MSQILWGNCPVVTSGGGAIDHYHNGLPFTVGSALAVADEGVIDYYHQGLPFTATGRLAITADAVDRIGNGAAPFSASGQLCMVNSATVDHTSAGICYHSTGSVNLI